ncbi:DUF262 domain-containing protein [Curtobacterium sp. MCBD17_040]|uniref:DUF262 domain-containing protein n=1 Tax=Curtobacterium sp. MCBD17_040 TaxID=2175674 RepID=UPI0015E8B45D|nr:DUF262 domain-containing protein [Curtobacterium sp. MCBD17_040]WIB65382.1 DUF262 domain-containing protein [Curtobacterium sp. MCBD17_040]
MTDIIRGRDIGGAPNDTRFGEHRRAPDDITLGAPTALPEGLTFDGAPIERLKLEQGPRALSFFTRGDEREELILDAPYQRGSVWDDTRRQLLVKSVLLGIPTGSITINTRPYNPANGPGDIAVVDGRQRIEALRGFVDSDYPIPANWVPEDEIVTTTPVPGWPKPGVRFRDLAIGWQRNFLRNPVSVSEARVTSIQEEAEMFRLINAGGVAQTADTMANALAVEQGWVD